MINIHMRFDEFNIQEGRYDSHIFKAVFMAGAPGSGKSTVSKMLFSGSGLKPVNIDIIDNFYRKTRRNADRDQMHWKKSSQREMYEKGRLGLVIDGTGRMPEYVQARKQKLESLGYETALVFVDVDLEQSLKRAHARATNPDSPDYGREIDPAEVEKMHREVYHGKKTLMKMFDTIWEIDNSGSKPDITSVYRAVNRWLNTPPANPVAQQWLKDQSSISNDRARSAS